MALAAHVACGLVAGLHAYFLVLEMFLWTKPLGRKVFGTSAEFAKASAGLAANQGLYNGFLVAGLIWGLLREGPVGKELLTFFLLCVVAAGIYGGWSVNKRIVLVQAVPAGVALLLLRLG